MFCLIKTAGTLKKLKQRITKKRGKNGRKNILAKGTWFGKAKQGKFGFRISRQRGDDDMKTYNVMLCGEKGFYYSYMEFATSSKQAKEIARGKIKNSNRPNDKIISARSFK